jgi:hypothetical protein
LLAGFGLLQDALAVVLGSEAKMESMNLPVGGVSMRKSRALKWMPGWWKEFTK